MNKVNALKNIFKHIAYIMNKKQKQQCVFIFLLIVMSGLCDTLGIAVIVPFIQAMLTPEIYINNKYLSFLANALGVESEKGIIILLGVIIIVVFVLKNLFLLFSNFIQIRYKVSVRKILSIKMLKSYMKRPYTYFLDVNTSDLINGIGYDVDCVYAVLENIFLFLTCTIRMTLVGIYLLTTDLLLATGILATAIFAIAIMSIIFKPRMKRNGIEQRDAIVNQSKWAMQAVNAIKDIKVMDRSKEFIIKYERAFERRRKAEQAYAITTVSPPPIVEIVAIIGLISVICVRIIDGVEASQFIPSLAALAVSAIMILPSVSGMVGYMNQIVFHKPAMDAAYYNLKEANEYEAKTRYYEKCKDEVVFEEMKQDLQLKNLVWGYPNADKFVLNGLNLTVKKGETVAIIGASGAGKTTLSDIVLGLLKPQAGSVEIDGTNIYSIPESWSKMVGYVPQTIYLLDDTIQNNILFGIEPDKYTECQVWEALEQAQLKTFVEGLPKGLNTMVGERGVKMSGGQRQRVAIARALFYNPEILILDEATSALDTDTETAVMESINLLQGKKTMIIIAHRLDTIRNCDKIYEIVDGKAVYRRHEEVL